MQYENKKYKPRLIDKKVDDYLSVFGAIYIEGCKWCGKTWTSIKHSKSITYMDDDNNIQLAMLEPKSIFTNDLKKRPQLIDEWHLVPGIWDAVRRECDNSPIKGNFILTGSKTLSEKNKEMKIHHSGVGRIGRIKMYTMSLYESGDSTGKAKLTSMYDGTQEEMYNGDVEIFNLAKLIVRGGWPENLTTEEDKISIIPRAYINAILDDETELENEKRRDRNKMLMLLRSLARNETTTSKIQTLVRDIEEYETEEELLTSRDTVMEYLDYLDRLHLIENQDAYSLNYRSRERVGKTAKRHFTDPSLSCAILGLTPKKLLEDINTFGLLFESLVMRDLRIYMDYLDGKVYHFRDNVTGLEVDAILEFPDSEYAAVEVKLGDNKIEEAKSNLLKFSSNMLKQPKFMCIIVGKWNGIVKDKETGIYIIPITALKP